MWCTTFLGDPHRGYANVFECFQHIIMFYHSLSSRFETKDHGVLVDCWQHVLGAVRKVLQESSHD